MHVRTVHVPALLDAHAIEGLRVAVATDDLLVLEGGADTFCRGLAPGEWADLAALREQAAVLLALRSRSAPTVAVVCGEALGGGLGLVAACDVVLAAPTARFALPELLFGLSPSIILPFLRERVLPAPLRRLMLTGATVDAAEALRLGLVDEVADLPDPRRVVRALGRGEPGARGLVKAVSPAFEAEVWAACEVTAERIASAPARARRARFAAGDAPWEVA